MALPRRSPARFRRVAPTYRFPRAVLVNQRVQTTQPGVGDTRLAPPVFVPDGFNYPRAEDTFFDAVVRVPQLTVNATVRQTVFTLEENVKGGWIRKIGYGFNNPQGFFQVRTTLLINGAPPAKYIYKTIDASTGAYQGSFPTVQLGGVEAPTEVFILIPANSLIEVTFQNTSTTTSFSCAVRLWGWFFVG